MTGGTHRIWKEARLVLVTKSGIRVISYVHTERGLVDFDELAPEEQTRAATAIKLKYMNELYRGKAVFEAGGTIR